MEQQVSNNDSGVGRKRFAPIDYVKITILGFGVTALWSGLQIIVLPPRLLDLVPALLKNTYLGYMTFTGLVLAMVTQPIVGAISDRSSFTWGRRRPYILVGITLVLLFLPGIGLWDSYGLIFMTYCLLQISSNTAQGPYQGFIPDMVAEDKRGVASGVKTLLEASGGAILVLVTGSLMSHYFAGEGSFWLWITLGTLGIVLLGTMLATLLTVKERPGTGGSRLPLLPSLLKSFQIDVKQNRDFIWFLVSRGLMGMPGVMLLQFAQYYLMDVVGIANPVAVAGDLVIAVGAGLIAVVYFTARLSDRIGRKPILIPSGLLGALGIVLLFFSRSYIQIMASGALIGIASGAFLSVSWALATDLVAKGEEAKYLGLTNMAMTAGSALARLIGPVIDFFNTFSTNLGYSVMLLVSFVCFIAGSLLILKVKGVK